MPKKPRNPFKFELFNLFAQHAKKADVSIRSSQVIDDFIAKAKFSISDSLAQEQLLFGLRTEILFGDLVPILGRIEFLKKEDTDNIFVLGKEKSIEIPDYRLLLKEGTQLLIEVKNVFQNRTNPYAGRLRFKKLYWEGLVKYGQLMKSEVKVAIYWSIWNWWTLIPIDSFLDDGNHKTLEFRDAIMKNQMSALGDVYIGCQLPLRLEIFPREKHIKTTSDRVVSFHPLRLDIYCRNKPITDDKKRQIAFNLMVYGNMELEGPYTQWKNGVLEKVEYVFNKQDGPEKDKGWGIIDSVSSMFSRFCVWQTRGDDKGILNSLYNSSSHEHQEPLIPDNLDLRSDEFPLAIFSIEPRQHELPTIARSSDTLVSDPLTRSRPPER